MLWASIVALPYLTKLFTNRDSAHPQLLFVYRQLDKLVFLSSPQPQNLDENSSYVAVKHLPRIPFHCSSCYVSGLVQGLLSLRVIRKRMQPVHIICNPSTGQALTLPKIKRMRGRLIRARNLLGYDPIDNQSRSETFSFIEVEGTLKGEVFSCTLINYNGKLGSLITRYCFVDRACRSIKLLVIGNFEKQESSKHEYVLPPMWEDVVGRAELRLVGLVGTNEVVLSDPSQVIYYNIETRGVAKVAIQGIEASPECEFATFLHHIEDLKLAQAFK
ncbi:hypothetical protein Bca101_042868 [Brassica carinata]